MDQVLLSSSVVLLLIAIVSLLPLTACFRWEESLERETTLNEPMTHLTPFSFFFSRIPSWFSCSICVSIYLNVSRGYFCVLRIIVVFIRLRLRLWTLARELSRWEANRKTAGAKNRRRELTHSQSQERGGALISSGEQLEEVFTLFRSRCQNRRRLWESLSPSSSS